MAKLEVSIGCKVDKEYEAQLDRAVSITGDDRAAFIRDAVRVAMARTIKASETHDSGTGRSSLRRHGAIRSFEKSVRKSGEPI